MEQLLFNKVDFAASKFEAALSLQIEARGKIKGVTKLFGQKTLEISFPKGTLKSLTIPNAHATFPPRLLNTSALYLHFVNTILISVLFPLVLKSPEFLLKNH